MTMKLERYRLYAKKKNGLRRTQTVRPRRSQSFNLQNTELWLQSPSLGSLLWQPWKTNIDLTEIKKAVWNPCACYKFGFQPHLILIQTCITPLQPDCPTAIAFAMAAIIESTHAQSSHESRHKTGRWVKPNTTELYKFPIR